VAPDLRGYGQTDQPPEIDQYTLLHSIGDMVGLLDALGAEQAVIVGHDWGAPLAWGAAVLRPDRFRGVIALSGPFGQRAPHRPTTVMPQNADRLLIVTLPHRYRAPARIACLILPADNELPADATASPASIDSTRQGRATTPHEEPRIIDRAIVPLASGIHRPGARSGGDRAIVPRLIAEPRCRVRT
jgi:pimeloyl-ACP methyl ester carboxylesterase